jgi:hypothetical protein
VHRFLSGTLVVVAYHGHRSGREFRIPLRYAETADGAFLALAVQPERKLWWRSFTRPARATLLIRGERRPVRGRVVDGAERRTALDAYLVRYPRATGPLGLPTSPSNEELDGARAAIVRFEATD